MRTRDIQINGEIFRRKREELNLTVREVEEMTGVSRSTVSNLELNRNVPDGLNLYRLMTFFKLSMEEIALRR